MSNKFAIGEMVNRHRVDIHTHVSPNEPEYVKRIVKKEILSTNHMILNSKYAENRSLDIGGDVAVLYTGWSYLLSDGEQYFEDALSPMPDQLKELKTRELELEPN